MRVKWQSAAECSARLLQPKPIGVALMSSAGTVLRPSSVAPLQNKANSLSVPSTRLGSAESSACRGAAALTDDGKLENENKAQLPKSSDNVCYK